MPRPWKIAREARIPTRGAFLWPAALLNDDSQTYVGKPFPKTRVQKFGGGEIDLGKPSDGRDWQMVIVYRGKHCPLCTKYLTALNAKIPGLNEIGIDVVAVSADPENKVETQMNLVKPAYPVGYGLTIDQMKTLGVYISDPRSEQETDRPFAEPGLFIINGDGNLHMTDISNAPFSRPDLDSLVSGLAWIRNPENNYPIRGTHPY